MPLREFARRRPHLAGRVYELSRILADRTAFGAFVVGANCVPHIVQMNAVVRLTCAVGV